MKFRVLATTDDLRETAAQGGVGAGKVERIAFLEAGSPALNRHFLDAFERGLRELGHRRGAGLVIDERWADGRAENFHPLLSELVILKPDVIVVASTLGALAAKAFVTTIPVVFVGVTDPLGAGLVESLARPGGNLTGVSRGSPDGPLGKVVALLGELAPQVRRCALLWNPHGAVEAHVREARRALRKLGITPLPHAVAEDAGFDAALAAMSGEGAEALVVIADPLTLRHRHQIADLALRERIPTVCEFAEFARAGALLAYSPSVPALFHRAAWYVHRILQGAQPAELAVEPAPKFELAVNLRTADALGIGVPEDIVLRADEVIE